ncbi:hypothetical protein FI667_g12034, partial [Globisporangium splendens]
MTKFFFYAAAALCAVFGAQAQTTKPPCQALNFSTKATDINSLNAVIDIAINTGLLKKNIPQSILVNNSAVSVVPFSVLGIDFELTPIIQQLNVTGLVNIVPGHLSVTAANAVAINANINGSIIVDATIRLQIQQLNHKWYEICWTNILNPAQCPPSVIDIDLDLSVVKPAVAVNAQLDLLACGAGVATSVCKDVTVSDILIAALTNKFDAILTRLLRRFSKASILDLGISFESITNLGIHFHSSGPLITEIGKQLLNFSVEIINKKGDIYNTLIDILQKVFKSVLNNVLSGSLASRFGNTCYDS